MSKHRQSTALIPLILLITLVPGFSVLLYSQTFIHSGIGPVSWWWTYGYYGDNVTLVVNSSIHYASVTTPGEQLVITGFHTNGSTVSIVVFCETEGVILNHSRVAGAEIGGIIYPDAPPSGNVDRDFNITVLWEGESALVNFFYYTNMAMHADGAVYWTSPGFEETRDFGYSLLLGGSMVCILALFIVFRRTREYY